MTSKAERPTIAVSVPDIVSYWRKHECESRLSVDWAEAHERCWRCARKIRLEKCHIIPRALGGKDKPENLVLLCQRCHREAPNVSDPSFIWIWLRRYANPLYDTDWIVRGYEEFERIFRRKPFQGAHEDVPQSQIIEALKKHRKKMIIHYGEGRPNPSSVAWLFSQIEKELIGRGSIDK